MMDEGNRVQPVETAEWDLQPARVRLPFRILGAALVPLFILPVLMGIYTAVEALRAGHWRDAASMAGFAAAMAFFMTMQGRKILRAVRTGVDPDSEDRMLQEASSRAMLAAVRGTDPGE
jgi:hypothetical protein